MGAWGTGSFENDDAADWIAELATIVPDDLTQIFVQAADYPSYLEAPASRVVVAAAEVIAALSGSPAQEVPPEIIKWTTAALAQAQTFTTLYSFTFGSDGGAPFAGVVQDAPGGSKTARPIRPA